MKKSLSLFILSLSLNAQVGSDVLLKGNDSKAPRATVFNKAVDKLLKKAHDHRVKIEKNAPEEKGGPTIKQDGPETKSGPS